MEIMNTSYLLIGILQQKNLGDNIIYANTKYLISNVDKTANFKQLDLSKSLPLVYKVFRKASKYCLTENKYIEYMISFYENLYAEYINNIDKIIFAGGGLIKYKYQFFWAQISAIIRLAEKKNIPVFMNAVGVEGYSETNKKCQILKQHLNKSIVKQITLRNDSALFLSDYLTNKEIICYEAGDPALFTNQTYKTEKKDSKTIGIGLVRSKIFLTNEINFSEKEVINFYINLINALNKEGYNIKIFTNGLKADSEYIETIISRCNLSADSIFIPQTDEELVSFISDCDFIFASRLHACIVSYSLNIPCVGFIWNEKLKMFGDQIGMPERFITYDKLNPENLITIYNNTHSVSYDAERRKYLEDLQLKSIKDIVGYKGETK